MLNLNIASSVLQEATSLGATFADIFVEKNQSSTLSILGQKVHEANSGIDFGIGIRLVFGTNVVYGYTNSIQEDELIRITRLLSAQYKQQNTAKLTPLHLKEISNNHPVNHGLNNDIDNKLKIDFLMKVDQGCREHSSKIIQVDTGILQRFQEIEIFNTLGLHTSDSRHYSRLRASCIAEANGEQSTGFEAPGALKGWEFFDTINPNVIGSTIAKQAEVKLSASDCPAGKMPVVIGNGFGGVIFHEACGHLLETTSVQKKASVFHDKLGEQIASSCVSAYDDGTILNEWGSINIDDEGNPTQKTELIKNGKLTSFMVDFVGHLKTDFQCTGSGRRESYKFAPASRMRNTYIAPGNDSIEDMISSIDKGIYCKKMGGGSVMPGTGEFNFAANESYLIKNGKITTPLKSATLIGTGPEILTKISMISDDFELTAGMCGSVSGAVPTTVGQATLKVDEILVGGKSK
ncbi:MAG: TldD/PmbA family protein [Bdellovibrionales bacterium]|jgi:TldD protein|nr:TldD/PmbA family protein [Bdellovibrionales bacterium]